jgi:hypothetical protein
LDNKSISVITGNSAPEYRQVYDTGVTGNGTEKQRVKVSKMIEGMGDKDKILQREQIKLSSTSRFVQLEGLGYLVISEDPEHCRGEVGFGESDEGMAKAIQLS